ncbi:16S rRNA (guanine(966)-N(2))-methyltransferase RsmD [Thalassotalea mangrovi]|uniref:Ribosomal RNA small subunit methyltransferase D n=1 Tax=Thalassotalea mangrovi TaxID=2572245 RepID=A0A4U1B513_9GAMM|nr:16S rRNA (guanine(966)-N(2))-methyltransferase RsmD [Thalassotalea mangrovi]TKB45409.1 16S rRNA (guanine(966)-N(2))-methyltransferase RsmD [Thalassotalea mangrovi]
MASQKPTQRNHRHKDKPQSKNQQAKAAGQVRVIAGKYRGRKLPVIDAQGLRPTTDRIKETVFNWLMPYVANAVCLDSCAGSGSLGFEALSRGAQHVTFVELEKLAAKQIKDNIKRLQDENSEVLNQTILNLASNRCFDLVFIDPPFNKGLASDISNYLEHMGLLTPDAIIYVETETQFDSAKLPDNWQLIKEKSAGQVMSRLFLRHEN